MALKFIIPNYLEQKKKKKNHCLPIELKKQHSIKIEPLLNNTTNHCIVHHL